MTKGRIITHMIWISLMLLGIWWLRHDHQPEASKPINRITRTVEPVSKQTISEPKQIPQPNQQQLAPQPPVANHDELPAVSNWPKTYLQLYRDFRLSENCHAVLVLLAEDPGQGAVKEHMLTALQARSTASPVIEMQHQILDQHIDACLALYERYHSWMPPLVVDRHSPPPNGLTVYLSEQLSEEVAHTPKEQHIKALRQLIKPWDEAWTQLIQLLESPTNESDPAILALRQEIEALRLSMQQQKALLGEAYTQEMYRQYIEQAVHFSQQIDQLLIYDQAGIDHWNTRIKTLNEQISTFLSMQDPDLYYEASSLLNEDRQMKLLNAQTDNVRFKGQLLTRFPVAYQTLAQSMNLTTGPTEGLNFRGVASFANHLYLCALGQDCGPGSELSNMYCLGNGYHRIVSAACDKDLLTFYVEDFLSPNQQTDVFNLFDQLVGIYGL